MGLFWAVARCSSLEELRARLGLVPVWGKSLATAGAPCAISLKCDFGAWDVWGNAACFTPARSGSLFLYLSFALWPCSLGQVEGLAHLNFIFDKVILCNCGGDVLWLMALMSCVAVG